jgi:ArsR family transcriptional regulator, arsenate/arsenite/antimonite-responsive transcriptional repressor
MSRPQAPAPGSLLAAFADPTRLRLLNLLHAGEQCVGDLVVVLGAPQPTVSRHLAHLREAGLVEARKEGLWVYYALARPRGAFHARLVDCLGCCFREVPELARDRTRAASLQRRGGCCPRHAPGAKRPRPRRPAASRRLDSCCPEDAPGAGSCRS